ncbi:MAG: hypothetical protein E4G90_02195 [Gemmatimonadales bacterium]|nr:MAG: hypothetical protein E4G90_02195 [Gemmatimonadales bacterium]
MSAHIFRHFPSSGRLGSLLLGFLVLSPFLFSQAEAQFRDRGPIILELPASTRALALGHSFVLGSPDPDAVFYHPGLLNAVQGLSGSVQRYGTSATLATFSAGQSWFSGGVVLGIQHLSYGASAEGHVLGADLLGLPADIGSLRENGEVGVSELAVSAGYGRSIKGIRMGLVGKLIEERFGPRKSATGAIDLGAAASPGPITVGLAVQNLGPAMTIGGEEIPLPLRFALGVSSDRRPVGPLDLSASSAVSYRLDGDVIPSLGIEVAYWPVTGRTFVGRLGVRHLPKEQSGSLVTFGGAFLGDDIILDYAYEGFESGSPAHRFSIGWR